MRRLFALLPIALVLCAASARADGDLLGQVRQQVDAPAAPCSDDHKHKDQDGDCDGLDDTLGEALGPLIGEALLAPFAVPALALGDDYQSASLFPRFPYAYNRPGYLWLVRGDDGDPEPRGSRP